MHELILWCGFAGAWLLVAGPVYQAVLELGAEEIERERIGQTMREVGRPPRVSPLWWLLPPVAFLIHRSRQNRVQHEVTLRLSDEDFFALRGFLNKATGWLMVGAGGVLIAVKETWELVEAMEWHVAVFWTLVLVMLLLSVSNAAARSRGDQRLAQEREARRQS